MMVRLMIHHPDLIPTIKEEGILRDFESPIFRKMAEDLEGLFQKKGGLDLTEALGCFEGDFKERLYEFAFQESDLEAGNPEKILRDCMQKIRMKRLKKDEGKILKRIEEAEKQKGGKGLEALLMERQELMRRGRTL
jgi:hypothetical protein